MKFTLWLEFEHLEKGKRWSLEQGFTNIGIQFSDGRYYALNVWTYQFLEVAVRMHTKSGVQAAGTYEIPPDLFVRELTRECIETAIGDLVRRGNLEDILNTSIFGIRFLAPWIDALDLPNMGNPLQEEITKELNESHPLFGKRIEVVAKREDNDDILVCLADRSLATVHLTWSSQKEAYPYPRTEFFKDKKAFWQQKLKKDIEEHNQ